MPPDDPLDDKRQFLIRDYNDKVKQLTDSGVTNIQEQALLDNNDNPTPLAYSHIALVEDGLINENGTPTDKGLIYSTTYRDSVDGDPKIYIEREKLGLNKIDKANEQGGDGLLSDLGKGASEFAKQAWSFSPARIVAKRGLDFVGWEIDKVADGVRSLFNEEEAKKPIDLVPKFLESPRSMGQAVNAQASMVQGGLDTIFMVGGGLTYLPQRAILNIQSKEDEALAAKQQQERANFEFNEINGAELIDSMLGVNALMDNRDQLVKQHGEKAIKEQEKGARIAGGFAYDPINMASAGVGVLSNAGLKTALWAERTALTGRGLALEAADIAGRRANIESKIAKADSLVQHTTARASALSDVGNIDGAMRYNAYGTRAAELVTNLTTDVEGLAARQAVIDADIASIAGKQAVADKIVRTTNKWNAAKQIPANAVATVAMNIGDKLIKTDEFVTSTMEAMGAKAVYDAFKSMPTKVTSFASTSVLGPIAAVPAVVTSVLGAGPLIQSIGNFSRVIGEQVLKERGSSSYWRRVANAGVDKPQRMFSKFMDEATLGGSLTNAAKIVAKGTAHAYPMNLAFEVLQDPNLDVSNAAKRAVAPSLIFGGGGAGAAQIFKGSAGRLKDVRAADHINMIRSLTDSQKSVFYKMDNSGQQLVSSYAASYPNLNWEFKENGASNYDPALNIVSVNINTNNPIRSLITHEVLHYGTIKNNLVPAINQLLFGFEGEAGLIKSKDGVYDPHFQKFHDEYNARLESSGLEKAPIEKIGEEYFIESTVDHVLEQYDKGKLDQYTGRIESSRVIHNVVRSFVEKRPILRDLFLKSGGVYDAKGKMVMGNGLLADGIISHPESRRLVQQMLRESAADTRVAMGGPSRKFEKGKLFVDQGSPVVDSFHAVLEYDSNGNPVKVDGVHKTISRQTDEARSMAGHILTEAQTRRVAGGYMPSAGELKMAKDGSWKGQYIHRALLDELAVKSALNSKQISILRSISAATKTGDGTRFLLVNHPATIKGRGGKVRYASLEATLRDAVPTAFSVTKQGNIQVHLMSVDQLHTNIEKRAASKTGDKLYGGNTELIKQDVSAMMDLHSRNEVTDGYYQNRYGPAWKQHKDFINTVFGLMTKEQKLYNPMFDTDKIGDGGVFRTYRADRISKAVKDHAAPMPMGYEHIKVNLLPEGIPASVEARHTKELRAKFIANENYGRQNGEPSANDQGRPVTQSNFPPESTGQDKMTEQVSYMPEPMKKPYGPNDPLPSFETTVVKGEADMKGFKWDKATNVAYDIGGGKKMSFSYDPAYLVKPKFGDPKKLLKDQAVIMLEADKARATGGDMGGVNFPNLRSNHVTVTGPDGIDYRVKWANMTSTFVSGSKNRMQSHGAKYALIQLMDDFALKSNKRTARTLDQAMKDAKLSSDQNNMIAMAMNYGIIVGKKGKLSSTATALKRTLSDATSAEKIIINEKIKSTLAERDALNPSPDEMEVFKVISSVKTAMSNVATGRWKQKTIDNAFDNLQSLKNGEAYKSIIGRIKSPYVYDNIGNTFTDRGAAVGSITSVKLGDFNVEKIMRDSSDFKEAKNLDIVSAVELSQNPDFFALYFGKDPLQEAAMSVSERSARDKMLSDNNFQVHESYDWAMIGPVKGGDFIFDKPVRPEEIFKKYRSVHEKESVKSGSEETVAGAMRKSAEYKLTAYGDTVKMTGEGKAGKAKKTK
jgi:hypothetical protein